MNIEQLAKEMNVTVFVVENLTKSILNYLQHDDVAERFLTMSEAQQIETIQAYVLYAVNKMKEFQISYMTNTDVKALFNDMVYGALKND